MIDAHGSWPFFEPRHRELAERARAWAEARLDGREPADVDARCRQLVRELAEAGWLAHAVARPGVALDLRGLCLLRETLSYREGLADFALAMQGLGTAAIAWAGGADLQGWVADAAAGERIAALAISEPGAGSDVAAIATVARRDGSHWVLDGRKTWVSNGGIADFYCVLARTGEGPGSRGLSVFAVAADDPGLSILERIEVSAPHPLATIELRGCRIPYGRVLGAPGTGFSLAMRVLDAFRPTVAAAAVGLARRALDEALDRCTTRRMFGATLADLQLTQAAIADMITEVDAAALLTYRAAWTHDLGAPAAHASMVSAMAKMAATENAQRVVDRAVQLFGGLGVTRGSVVERLYREVRALRIYEGATEVQKLVIARRVLAAHAARAPEVGDGS